MAQPLALSPETTVSVRELQAAAARRGPSLRFMLVLLLIEVADARARDVPKGPKP